MTSTINFEKCTVLLVGAYKVVHSAEHGRYVTTLEAHTRKTVQFTKSIMEINVVQNGISDNFYFDEYPVQSISNLSIFQNNGKNQF